MAGLTHPDRVVYPDLGITKRQVADYYAAAMDWLLPGLAGRPVAVLRCPEGVAQECFFQKHRTAGLAQVPAVAIEEADGGRADYLVVEKAADVMALVQFNVLEFHPWGALAADPDRADRVVFDLDPAPGVPWAQVREGARQVRDLLRRDGLRSFLRTSGGKGLHVVAPVSPPCPWDPVRAYARSVAEALADRRPERYVATSAKSARTGRIFIDYLRNGRGATSIASYSLRARPGATVAMPLRWDELGRLGSAGDFDIRSAPRRLARLGGDPWEGIAGLRQDIPGG